MDTSSPFWEASAILSAVIPIFTANSGFFWKRVSASSGSISKSSLAQHPIEEVPGLLRPSGKLLRDFTELFHQITVAVHEPRQLHPSG